jgi:ribosomal protein L31
LEADVSEREGRVDRLRERFVYYFDPTQLQSIIREESQKIHPQQRPIVWVDAP